MDAELSTATEIPQPESFSFDEESLKAIDVIVKRYPPGRQASAVIPLLYVVQRQMRRSTGSAWVPNKGMDAVAERLGMAPIRVYEVATFYFMFNMKPIGRHHLQVCATTPCWLRGSDEVSRACRDAGKLGGWGQTSEDGMFTLSEVECLGGCVNAPILQVDDDYYEDMDYESTVKLIEALRRGERPAPGSVIGRQTSAPEGGPQTLLDVPGE
ncbi:NAD(P)H-dependent oxidoreductase subunit E [Belnapia sp. T18]|uniref:NAD(P)H-dependent oxidoreductase subunit E n=1 Tax=Belnapia arida TaxID=2804533 RepID=A0ABS1U835_9PROT|nr:NAD(P)H-dependent oxidoreductase subunit E [Belnapia arida]MBL6080837.1 NAD(P)H-dependent oxidoreductase subunit E [Belnapia arida]